MALGGSPGRAPMPNAVTDPDEPLVVPDRGPESGRGGYRKWIRCHPRRTTAGDSSGDGRAPPRFDTEAPRAVALALLLNSLVGPMASAVGFAIALGMGAWRGRVRSA